jgi:hypothetical protein
MPIGWSADRDYLDDCPEIRWMSNVCLRVLNVKSIYARQLNIKVSCDVLNEDRKEPWPSVEDLHTAMAIFAHRPVIAALNVEIKRIESQVRRELKENRVYRLLQSVPGIGPILAWVILLEGRPHRHPLHAASQALLRAQRTAAQSHGRHESDLAQAGTGVLLHHAR